MRFISAAAWMSVLILSAWAGVHEGREAASVLILALGGEEADGGVQVLPRGDPLASLLDDELVRILVGGPLGALGSRDGLDGGPDGAVDALRGGALRLRRLVGREGDRLEGVLRPHPLGALDDTLGPHPR